MIINKQQFQAIKFAAKDELRSALCTLHFNPKGNFVEATNGHIMARVQNISPYKEKTKDTTLKPFTMPAKTINKIINNIPKTSNPIYNHVDVYRLEDEMKFVITGEDSNTHIFGREHQGGGKFPMTQAVVDMSRKNKTKISIDARYLKIIADYFISAQPDERYKEIIISFDSEGMDAEKMKPVHFKAKTEEVKIEAFLMPMLRTSK